MEKQTDLRNYLECRNVEVKGKEVVKMTTRFLLWQIRWARDQRKKRVGQ